MGIMDRLKKALGIGQSFDPKDYIDPKQLNPPEVEHPPYEIGAGMGWDAEKKPIAKEEGHWWRDCAERELPYGEYYVKNFTEEQLKELVVANRTGHDISVFADPRQTPEQLRYIYRSAEGGEDISKYIHNLDFDPIALNEAKSAAFLQEIMESHNAKKEMRTQRPSLDDQILSASTRTAEAHSTDKTPLKESTHDR